MSIKEILQISTEMLESAECDRWDQVQSKEVVRQKLLTDFFSSFSPEYVNDEEEQELKKISEINTLLVKMAESVKQEFISEVASVLSNTKAVQKYKKHSNI